MSSRSVTKAALAAGLAAFCLAPAGVRAADVALTFGSGYLVDLSGYAGRDPTQPFYFNLMQPIQGGPARPYKMVAEPGSNFRASIDPVDASGRGALRTQLLPYVDGCAYGSTVACTTLHRKDKVQLAAVDFRAPDALTVTRRSRSEVSFDMKLDRSYEIGQNRKGLGGSPWVIHFQIWQCCYTPPPFAVYVRPAATSTEDARLSPVELLFIARDDVTYNAYALNRKLDPTAATPFYAFGREIYRMTLPRDRWSSFRFQFEPSFNGDGRAGQIVFWLDGVKRFDYRNDWGFRPSPTTPTQTAYRPPTTPVTAEIQSWMPLMGVELGIYRYPFQTGAQTVLFSNFRSRALTPLLATSP